MGLLVYCRFFSINTMAAPTTMIVTIKAAVEIAKYISVGGRTVSENGDAVGIGSSTAKDDSADDGQ